MDKDMLPDNTEELKPIEQKKRRKSKKAAVTEDVEATKTSDAKPDEEAGCERAADAPEEYTAEGVTEFYVTDEVAEPETVFVDPLTPLPADTVEEGYSPITEAEVEDFADVSEPEQVTIFSDEVEEEVADSEVADDTLDTDVPTPDETVDDTDKKESRTRAIDGIFDFLELFVFTLAAVLLVTTFFFRHSIVDGQSMQSTLEDKETLIISDFLYEPKYKDIIVCEDYSTALKKPIVKRVIATEGQTVKITRNAVFVNGQRLNEPYVYIDEPGYTYSIVPSLALRENSSLLYVPGQYYEFVVPEGELFVMGDHRNRSTDSRDIGTVSEDAVLGKVILRIYPFARFGTVE